jgi:hypothetical protein
LPKETRPPAGPARLTAGVRPHAGEEERERVTRAGVPAAKPPPGRTARFTPTAKGTTMHWISQNSDALQVLLYGAIVLIWLVYLHIFVVSYLRQHRPVVLITQGAGSGLNSRCLISNLSLEPVHLLDVIVRLRSEEGEHRGVITDRTELSEEQLASPTDATNQRPLTSGSMTDIGSFEALIARVFQGRPPFDPAADLKSLEVVAVVATSSQGRFVGAAREYLVQRDDEALHLRPVSLETTQIRSRAGRRSIRRELSGWVARP